MLEGFTTKELIIPIIMVIILLISVIITAIVLLQKMARTISPATYATVAISPEAANSALSNFYIMASYNSCAAGDAKNDFVSLGPLVNVIAHGCRFLDFEIYDLDDNAVVAVSASPSFDFKGSFNSIPLQDVLNVVASQAASASNARDPLFLQFRIKSRSKEICDQTATHLQKIFGNYLLPNDLTYREGSNKNFGDVKLSQLIGKVVIAVDMSNPNVKNSRLAEFVNIAVTKPGNRLMTSNDLIYNAPSDIIDNTYQKRFLVTCVPDVTKPANYNSGVAFKYGVQIIAMQFQTDDNNLKLYIEKFNKYAFLKKPPELEYTPVVVPNETPLPSHLNDSSMQTELEADGTFTEDGSKIDPLAGTPESTMNPFGSTPTPTRTPTPTPTPTRTPTPTGTPESTMNLFGSASTGTPRPTPTGTPESTSDPTASPDNTPEPTSNPFGSVYVSSPEETA